MLAMQHEISLSETASVATSAAIRSLNVDFVRRGIVVSDAEDGKRELDPKIRRLVESLKRSCKAAGTRDVNEISFAIQLWKERSLHHTLQTLDQVKKADGLTTSNERQIQAIELHEKAGREIKDVVLRVLQNVIDAIIRHIDGFTVDLEVVVRELVRPEIEEELVRERAISERLILDKQRFMKEHVTLQDAHAVLVKRMDEWETAENGGGDAVLCRKLREQVKQMKAAQIETEKRFHDMERQNEQWRLEMVAMKTELDTAHKTLAMTRAMHDKETKQLVELVHVKEETFERVRQATTVAKIASTVSPARSGDRAFPPTITSYDANSGRSIWYQSPPKRESPSKPTRAILACLAPSHPFGTRPNPASSAPLSPTKRRVVVSPRAVISPNHQENETADKLRPPSEPSPRGRVTRPFSSPRS